MSELDNTLRFIGQLLLIGGAAWCMTGATGPGGIMFALGLMLVGHVWLRNRRP